MTIYDIAKVAGVSASTVSRVINDMPGVNPETRERIRRLLEENDYIPNEAARGLVKNASRLIGVLLPDFRSAHLTEGSYAIAKQLSRMGYDALFANVSRDQIESSIRLLGQRSVEAAVLMGSYFERPETAPAIRKYLADVPVFLINGQISLHNVYCVLADEQGGVRRCVRLMAEQGRKKIAFISDADTPSTRRKEKGYLKGLQELNEASSTQYERVICSCAERSAEGGRAAVRKILAGHPDTDAVICSIDVIGSGAVQELLRQGRSVPGDTAVIGIDNSVYATLAIPLLSSLNNRIEETSAMVSENIARALAGEKIPHNVVLDTSLVERETT